MLMSGCNDNTAFFCVSPHFGVVHLLAGRDEGAAVSVKPALATVLTIATAAAGHSCWGILNGPATGKAMAELIANGKVTCVDLAAFDPARFSRTRRGIFR